jgi:hypothetical protein
LPFQTGAQETAAKSAPFQAVPELPYRVVPNFFKFPKGLIPGEASAVAVKFERPHISIPTNEAHARRV